MKIHQLLIAASVMTFASLASAQTLTTSTAVKADPNAPAYSDPIVQKRHADRVAKAEYTDAKKAAKRKMAEENSVAKSEMKADNKQASATLKEAMAMPPTVSDSVK